MRTDYQKLFDDAVKDGKVAGFQNMGDLPRACDFAKKEGYEIEDSQELRSLITETDDKIWLMFLLRLKNGNDAVVFHLGNLRPNKYAQNVFHPQYFLHTKPKKIIELKNVFQVKLK